MATLTGTMPADVPVSTAGEPILLAFIPPDDVPKARRAFAQVHVRRLAKRHGLGNVRVRFFGPAVTGGDFYAIPNEDGVVPVGVAPEDQPNTIALHHGIRGDVVPFVIAHEIGHLLERRDGKRPDEGACDRFASRYVLGRI